MEKMIWSCPVAAVEQFMPNEYISACWGISCDYGEGAGDNGRADPINGNGVEYRHRQMANGQGCGHVSSQAITDRVGSDGQFLVIEINSPTGAAELPATLYGTDATYSSAIPFLPLSSITNGMTIYWTTSGYVSGRRITWHHMGQVIMDDSHPNRS